MGVTSRVRWRGGSLGPRTIVGIVVIVVASITMLNAGMFGGKQTDSQPRAGSASPSDSPAASLSMPDQGALATSGVWFSEIGYGQWVAGELGSGRPLLLPAGAIPLAGGSGLVVTGVRSPSSTNIAVWDLKTLKELTAQTVPLNVTGAAVATDGSTVYLTGTTGNQTIADTGVSALSIQTGEISQVLASSSLRPEWEGNAARGALLTSPSGKTLATALCGAPAGALDASCDIAAVDLRTGSIIGRASTTALYLAAVTDDTIVTRSQTSVVAFDFAGNQRWRFEAAEIRGPIAVASDAVVLAYAPAGTVGGPTRIANLSNGSGAVTDLIVAGDGEELSVWPIASDAATIVIGNGPSMEIPFGPGTAQVVLSTISSATGRVSRNALIFTPEN